MNDNDDIILLYGIDNGYQSIPEEEII